MKYTIISILIIGILVLGGFYFYKSKAGKDIPMIQQGSDLPKPTPVGTFEVDTNKSNINWSLETSDTKSYKGTAKFASGKGTIKDGIVTGGSFEVDLNSIKENNNADKLEVYFKSVEFFNTEIYPTAKFEITKISKTPITPADYTVTGNLTLKGITKEVTFPAIISKQKDSTFIASGDVDMDTSLWGIKYGGNSLFGSLGDKAGSNSVKLSLFIVTRPVTEEVSE
ncbi:MAG: YceI family protein [Candidatus Paceibacterota bacterium]